MAKFLDKTGLDTFWAKIKSTFQTLGNLVTAWGSTPSDTKYPSEKLVKDSLDTIPFNADFQFMTQSGSSDKCCIVKLSKPVNAYNGSDSTTVGLYVLDVYNYRSSNGPEYQSKVQLMIKITDGRATSSSVVAIDGFSGKYLPLSGFSLHVKTAVNNVVDIYLVYTTSANYVTCVGKFSRLWDVNYFTETWYKSSTSFTPFDASGDNVTKSVITDNILTKLTGFVGGTLSFIDGKPVIDTSALGTLDVEHGGTGNTSVDTAPTANSTKMVTSGGIFNALNDKATKIEFTQPAGYKSFVIIEDITRWYDPTGTAALSKGYQLIGQIAYWRSGGGYESMAVAFIKFHLNYRWQLTNDSCCEVKSTLPNNSFCPMIIRDARDENNVKYYFGLRTKIDWSSTVQFIGRTRDLSFSNLEWIPGENAAHTGNGTEFPVGITIERNCDLLEWNSIANGGTGATTAIGAEYNILNQVADIDTTINGDRKIALCNQTKSASNGVFRWLKLSIVWTWVKGLLSSESGVNISGNAATATALSAGDDRTKLDGIAAGAEVNVQSDWNQATTTADDYIKNKPTLGTAAAKDVPTSGNASNTQVVMGNDSRLADSRTPTAHTHTADAADVVDQPGDSAITDSTDIITTHVNGYTSTNKKLYRRNFKDFVWPWIKDKISSVLGLSTTGYTGNAATASAAKSGSALETAINGKAPTNHASSSDTYGKGTTSNYGHVKLATGDMNGASDTDGVACSKNHTHSQYLTSHQDISGKMATNGSNATSAAGGNIIRAMGEWGTINEDNEAIPAANITSGGTTQGRYKFSSVWTWIKGKLAGSDVNIGGNAATATGYSSSGGIATALSGKLNVNGSNATAAGVSALINALTTGSDAPQDNDYFVSQWAGGAQTSFHRRPVSALFTYIDGKRFSERNPAQNYVGIGTKRIQLGYALKSGAGYCNYLVHVFFNSVAGSLTGCGVTLLVNYDWNTTSQKAKCVILNDNGLRAAGYNIVLANFLSNDGTNQWMHITLGLVNNSAPGTLVAFTYSYCGIFRVNSGVNWVPSIASDTVGSYDQLVQAVLTDADTVDGYHIQFGSYSSRSDTISFY